MAKILAKHCADMPIIPMYSQFWQKKKKKIWDDIGYIFNEMPISWKYGLYVENTSDVFQKYSAYIGNSFIVTPIFLRY